MENELESREGRPSLEFPTVEQIHIATHEGGPMKPLSEATAIPGIGLESDRYALAISTSSKESSKDAGDPREVTFIEGETLDSLRDAHGVALFQGEHRRNITTRGIPLNDLVGKRFRVGPVLCEGAELAHPCGYLQNKLGIPDLVQYLAGRGGIRARVLEGGTITIGDTVELA